MTELHDGAAESADGLTLDIEKRVGHRLNVLLTDPQLFQVYQQFGGAVFRRSSIYHGLAAFLEANLVHGKTCFEIGSWNGLTALVLARYFDRVVSVDIAHNAVKREIIDALGVRNIEFIDIADNAAKKNVAERLTFDFAYVDGNHADDTAADFALVRRCGRVLFHEAWDFQPPVWELIHTLPQWQVKRGGVGLALWDASTPEVERARWERAQRRAAEWREQQARRQQHQGPA